MKYFEKYKKTMLLLALFSNSLAISAQSKEAVVNIKGTVPAGVLGKVYLQKFNNKIFDSVDSVEIVNGSFEFRNKLPLPELYGLTLKKDATPYYLFLEQGEVHVLLNPERGYFSSTASGSALQDEFIAYKKTRGVNIFEYIKQHPHSLVSAYVLYRDFIYRLTPEQITEAISLLDDKLQKSVYADILRDYIKIRESVGVGKQAPDFSLATPEGKLLSLKDVLQGKHYLLIDFWASWCGPCRRENPNVVKAYQEFHDKGFDILGVSLDRSREPWLKAIKDDSLTWHHVSDLKFWASAPAKLYGVRAIPSNFLVDGSGRIVAYNLRGEELLNLLSDKLK